MPNTSRGGGISRKITNVADRKRLKKIVGELEIPEGMAVIVRTAGSERNKSEIKRDYEYLLRLWSSIRELTLSSMAPALVYEEGNLIKRSIRDHYGRDIEEIVIQGDEEYRIAKEFMRLFIPSHAKRVKLYDNSEKSLFQYHQVENQLDAMHLPVVNLKSGGYIVINPTEALVAIDVNSGRATRERHIEETALRTNLEAADEVARQLRLRDLAGLIVIDFIDMEVSRYQTQVERRLKEAMKNDRARIQLGRISAFGLLELSRQRLRPSLLETSFEICPFCAGAGVRRTTESTALAILRRIEEEGLSHRSSAITLYVPTVVGLYLLNQKRKTLSLLEMRHGLSVTIANDDSLIPPDHRIDRIKLVAAQPEEVGATGEAEETDKDSRPEAEAASPEKEEGGKRTRRRRPRRRKRTDENTDALAETTEANLETAGEAGEEDERNEEDREAEGEEERTADATPRRRRRGKRGGRRRSRTAAEIGAEEQPSESPAGETVFTEAAAADGPLGEPAESESAAGEPEPHPVAHTDEVTEVAKGPRKRTPRRGRGGQRSRVSEPGERTIDISSEPESVDAAPGEAAAEGIAIGFAEGEPVSASESPAKKTPRARPRRKTVSRKQNEVEAPTAPDDAPELFPTESPAEVAEPAPAAVEARPKEVEGATGGNGALAGETKASEAVDVGGDVGGDVGPDTGETRRRGWWQKLLD
jgi:ribonuclease E